MLANGYRITNNMSIDMMKFSYESGHNPVVGSNLYLAYHVDHKHMYFSPSMILPPDLRIAELQSIDAVRMIFNDYDWWQLPW
jgi:hypothetical protein